MILKILDRLQIDRMRCTDFYVAVKYQSTLLLSHRYQLVFNAHSRNTKPERLNIMFTDDIE